MRSETQSSAWQAVPVRIGARHRALDRGQFMRSLVLVGTGVAVALALMPAAVGIGAPHDSAGRSQAAASRIFPDERIALHQPGGALSAYRYRKAD